MSNVALVTGANKGIGYAIVRSLALKYAFSKSLTIFLTARNPKLGQASVNQLEDELRQAKVLIKDGGNVELKFLKLDLIDEASIKNVEEIITKEYDAFLNNQFDLYAVRTTLATNFYGTLNITNHLFPLIRSNGRLINVSSTAGRSSIISESLRKEFNREDLDITGLIELMKKFEKAVEKGTYEEEGWPRTAYGVSKIGVTIMARIFARRANQEGKGILFFSCCPGKVKTDMGDLDAPRTPDQGAETPVFLALDNIAVPVAENGTFWKDEKIMEW